jgi:ribosome-associated toxin RatA of RatAB toxin-antitoxin module
MQRKQYIDYTLYICICVCLITRQWDRTKQNKKHFKITLLTKSILRSSDADKYIPRLHISYQKFHSAWTYGCAHNSSTCYYKQVRKIDTAWCKYQHFKELKTKWQKTPIKGKKRGVAFKVEMKNTWKALVRKLKGKYNHLEPSTWLVQ